VLPNSNYFVISGFWLIGLLTVYQGIFICPPYLDKCADMCSVVMHERTRPESAQREAVARREDLMQLVEVDTVSKPIEVRYPIPNRRSSEPPRVPRRRGESKVGA
jgi:hypothetical protein